MMRLTERTLWIALVASSISLSSGGVVYSDSVCDPADGNECEGATIVVDLVDDNPVVDLTDAPEDLQESIEDQDGYIASE